MTTSEKSAAHAGRLHRDPPYGGLRVFSLTALFAAIDAHRQAGGLSWAQTASTIGGSTSRGVHRLSASTIRGVGSRRAAEGDGVLQMLRWLERAPEEFLLPLQELEDREGFLLPATPPNRVLRFDTAKLFASLDEQRGDLGMVWSDLAEELGTGVSTLTYLARGGRTAFPQVMAMTQWLRQPAAIFTRASDW